MVAMNAETSDEGAAFPLANVSGSVLSKVLEYCNFHADGKSDEEKKNFDTKYFNELDTSMLFEVMLVIL